MLSPPKLAVFCRDFISFVLQNGKTNNEKTRPRAWAFRCQRLRKLLVETFQPRLLHSGDVLTKRGHFLYRGALANCLIQNKRKQAHPLRHRHKIRQNGAKIFWEQHRARNEAQLLPWTYRTNAWGVRERRGYKIASFWRFYFLKIKQKWHSKNL